MNNFVFGSADPLLYGNNMVRPDYINEPDIKRQLDTVMQQYQQLQQNKSNESPQKDWIGEFDNTLKTLEPEIVEYLNNDQEFIQLNNSVQNDIQSEIMSSIKWKINSKSDTVSRVKRMMAIIDTYSKNKANEDKKQMAEIADYLQNYSDMTFNEYKKLKEQS